MTNSAPPPPAPPRNVAGITLTAEGGGIVVTCECRWLRFYPTSNDAAEGKRLHVKKCKMHTAVGE
jgi:hypothetical protein